jgi:hypothetical protein
LSLSNTSRATRRGLREPAGGVTYTRASKKSGPGSISLLLAYWLVTSFLTPGMHRFAVRAKTIDGRTATDVHTARVIGPGPLPANLAGTWERRIGADQAGADLAGIWRFRISPVGWSTLDPKGGLGLIDVAYLSLDQLESRGPIWTGPAGPPRSPTEGNGWCDAPFSPVRYRFAVSGATLTLQLVGKDRCGGEHFIWAGVWNRSQ